MLQMFIILFSLYVWRFLYFIFIILCSWHGRGIEMDFSCSYLQKIHDFRGPSTSQGRCPAYTKWTEPTLSLPLCLLLCTALSSGSLCPSWGFLAFPQDIRLPLYSLVWPPKGNVAYLSPAFFFPLKKGSDQNKIWSSLWRSAEGTVF